MQFKCPQCQTAYQVADAKLNQPVMRARCKTCGAALTIKTADGTVKAVPAQPASSEPPPAANQKPTKPAAPVTSKPAPHKAGRDYVAIVILLAVIALSAGAVYYVTSRLDTSVIDRPLRIVKELIFGMREVDQTSAGKAQPTSKAVRKAYKLTKQAHKLYKQKKYAEAVDKYQQAIDIHPENTDAFFWQGRAFIKLNRLDEALGSFQAVVAVEPDHADACDNLGWLHMKRDEYETSLYYLNHSLSVKPRNGWALFNRGRIYFERGERERALEDARQACEIGYKEACRVYSRYAEKSQDQE